MSKASNKQSIRAGTKRSSPISTEAWISNVLVTGNVTQGLVESPMHQKQPWIRLAATKAASPSGSTPHR